MNSLIFKIESKTTHSSVYSSVLGQSDWSEIDNAFSSDDDDELFSYFETHSASNSKAAQSTSIVSNEALSEQLASSRPFDIRKGNQLNSEE